MASLLLVEKRPKLSGLFCFDPGILQREDIAPARIKYLLGCLKELQQQYQAAGSQLILMSGQPQIVIPKLAVLLKANAVYWNLDVEPYAKNRDQAVKEALQKDGILVQTCWDQLLHPPGEILTQTGKPYTIYTPFWKNWRSKTKASTAAKIKGLLPLTEAEKVIVKKAGEISLPTIGQLGSVWEPELLLAPGEIAAQARLEEFCETALTRYGEERNYPAIDGTSQLSAALKFGAIGIRTIWQAAIAAWDNSRSDETRSNIETWQQELAWREFYQHCLYFFPRPCSRCLS